jgi:capsule polysaccharide export protein KpsC/LpsZ
LFTNLVWDSAVLRQDLAFKSIVDWIVAAIEEFRLRPNDELVVRIHPAETKLSGRESREQMESAIRRRIEVLPNNVVIVPSTDPTSSYVLMREADFGLVYSSTSGMEMALSGKPVVVAAKTHYRGKGFTVDVGTPTEFSHAIGDLIENPQAFVPNLELAQKYAYLFFFRAPYAGLGVTEPIRGLVSMTSEDPRDLLKFEDSDVRRFISSMALKSSFNPLPGQVE